MSQDQILKEITNALGAHGAWKLKLKTAIAVGSTSITPQKAKCDRSCAFGTWLHGPSVDAETRRGMPYQVVKRLHAEFHESASRVVSLAASGKKMEASEVLDGEFFERSDKLSRALGKWKSELTG